MEYKRNKLFWIALLMFIIPEVLFSFVTSAILFLAGININYLLGKLFGDQYFIDHPLYAFLGIIVEIIGLTALFFWNIKLSQGKFKWLALVIIGLLLVFCLLILYSMFVMRNGIGF